jgi:hypothetical protein
MRALIGLCAGHVLAFAIGGCGSGGVPEGVPYVRTGGTRVITKNTAEPITSGERLGNALQPAVSQSGTLPTAGTGNDLTGGGGFEAVSDSDFIGIDEIDNFDDFQDIEDFGDVQTFGAGFAVPGLGAAGAGAAASGTTQSTTTQSSTDRSGTTTRTTTTTIRSTTNGQ